MSKAASTRNSVRSAGSSGPLRLLDSLAPLLHEWLPRQRWFAGKGRPVTAFTLVSATELLPLGAAPGLLHLLVRAEQDSPPPPTRPATATSCCSAYGPHCRRASPTR